ncbi:uncharacterized protein LOC131285298 [Anopheles ziemanni]|uniref:uncharacterized protein LOC131265553 n=1 Tax=Anopheles coustani TaxID=139045 RepID=UPI00265A4D79|nr:uncharacterized protein LOC131265553 [Anopheles coustani]XP_058170136.1 uncharacterized protein LOC131285298 [Anopheles ziemanni]
MSSKGKRASILKKQHLQSHNHDASVTANPSSTFKGNRKIEFNRKKSIKEFMVGEDTDTIWGNSYEVSTDGTPSSGLGDVTLGNSTCRSLADEQNKENRTQNLTTPPDDAQRPSPNSTNASWDLSITIADDEKRRIGSETSAMFSQSLNTTDRLFVEPLLSPGPKPKPKQSPQTLMACDVQAMDISPIKGNVTESAKRKMIYYNQKEELIVEINDVPHNQHERAGTASAPKIVFQTPTRSAMKSNASDVSSRTTFRGTSFNVSETWNSHPHAMMKQMNMMQSNLDDLANMSSDVDTTLAITNTVAKLLEAGPNITIPVPTIGMELDESTTTEHIPTNALARARPSFLPSQRAVDESQDVPQTSPDTFSTDTREEKNVVDTASPSEGHFPQCCETVQNLSHNNLTQQPMEKEAKQILSPMKHHVNKSSTSNLTTSRHGLSIDFGISSLSLKMEPNSPEAPTVSRPKILRPTLPSMIFSDAEDKTRQTPKVDELKRNLEKGSICNEEVDKIGKGRDTIHSPEDMDQSINDDDYQEPRIRGVLGSASLRASKPMETTYFDRTQQSGSNQSTLQEGNPYRSTMYEAQPIVEEGTPPPKHTGQLHRATVTTNESMEMTHGPSQIIVSNKPTGSNVRPSTYKPEKTMEQSIEMELHLDNHKHGNARGTIYETILVEEITPFHQQRAAEAVENQPQARKTYYPDEAMKVDTAMAVQVEITKKSPARKTFYPDETMKVDLSQHVQAKQESVPRKTIIYGNESIDLDICTETDEGIDTETSLSYRLYGRDIEELSIHASGIGRNVIDMKMIARPTTLRSDPCKESISGGHEPPAGDATMMIDDENIASVFMPSQMEAARDLRRLTSHDVRDIEEDTCLGSADKHGAACTKPAKDGVDAWGLSARSRGTDRQTIHEVAMMDETGLASDRILEPNNVLSDRECPMDRIKSHDSGAEVIITARPSYSDRSKRFTTHEPEEMDAQKLEQPATSLVSSKSRCSIYKQEDMDASENECCPTDCEVFGSNDEVNGQRLKQDNRARNAQRISSYDCTDLEVTKAKETSLRPRINSEGSIKVRYTANDNEIMADTVGNLNLTQRIESHENLREKQDSRPDPKQHPSSTRLSVYQTVAMDETKKEDQLNVTNYNAFLVNHEISQAAEKVPKQQRLTTCYMEGMGEAGLDSTRLSKERERQKSRPSSYFVEAMDETNGPSGVPTMDQTSETPTVIERSKQHQSAAALSSPMQLCPTGGQSSSIPTTPQDQQQDSQKHPRNSIYHPEAMESTLLPPVGNQRSEVGELPSVEGSCALSRRSKLRSIVQHTAVEDMEGFSLLTDDDVDVAHENQTEPDQMMVIGVKEETDHAGPVKKLAVKYRPTICHAEAMVEDTIALPSRALTKFATDQEKAVYDVHQSRPAERSRSEASALTSERKSSVCMEETMLPIAIRIERPRKSTLEKVPILCPAERPPSFENVQPPACDMLRCSSEDTMELTNVVISTRQPSLESNNYRQTMHQPSAMDMTFGPRESIIRTLKDEVERVPIANDRRTVYCSNPMDETPTHMGRSLKATEAAIPEPVSLEKSTLETESAMGERMRKPRQTILCPLDMEVDGDVEEPSLTIPCIDREPTEDCVLRSAPSMATREPSVNGHRPTIVQLSEILGGKENMEPGRGYTSSKFVPPSSTVHELSDISMCNATTTMMHPELPQIDNITAMMSLREITEPLPPAPSVPEQNNSVSVICRLEQQEPLAKQQTNVLDKTGTAAQQSIATQNVLEIASDDEFYDAEDDGVAGTDPLSLTKSRHLTMKFVDVEQLERTRNHRAAILVPSTTSKRGHAHLLCSPLPVSSRAFESDPLHVTQTLHQGPHQQQSVLVSQLTPQGPIKKRPRTSDSPRYGRDADEPEMQRAQAQTTDHLKNLTAVVVKEEIMVKQEHPAAMVGDNPVKEEEEEPEELHTVEVLPHRAGSQMIINDPSVFVIDEEDLLDDESNPRCHSLTEEILSERKEPGPAGKERTPVALNFEDRSEIQPISVGKMKELSFYRDFANLTIEHLESWDEEQVGVDDDDYGRMQQPLSGPCSPERNHDVDCISLSDDDESLSITPPKVMPSGGGISSLFDFKERPTSTEVLDSTIASEFMHELRQKNPPTRHACCKTQTDECLCRTKRELERRREAGEIVWGQYCTWMEAIKQRIQIAGCDQLQQRDEAESRHKTLEEQIEELNWRLLRTKLEQSSFSVDGMNGRTNRARSRSPIRGQFPETPSVVFLCENLQSYLSEQTFIDNGPPPGAPLPVAPSITLLISNKLSSDSGTRWQLDCSEENEALLVLRHRTLRSVVISVQLQQGWEKGSKRKQAEDRRLERIQVRECQQEYVHSPKLLLAHIEFMRLAKETTERTLRSTYRTVASLLGLWQHFDELLRRVFDSINRLQTIIRNNDALLCYDAAMERFYVKKYFQRGLDGDSIEPNMLTVHFNSIGNLSASGVSFKRMFAEAPKLLPGSAGNDWHAGGSTAKVAGSTDDQTGLMFLECLLWNVTKQFDSS